MLRPRSLLLAAAVLATAALPARAVERTECDLFYLVCGRAEQPDAKIIRLGGEDGLRHSDVTNEERRAWLARCQPRKVFDGLSDRWVYAEPGCASGP